MKHLFLTLTITLFLLAGCATATEVKEPLNYVPAKLSEPVKKEDDDRELHADFSSLNAIQPSYRRMPVPVFDEMTGNSFQPVNAVPSVVVDNANKMAMQAPTHEDYFNAIVKYDFFDDGILYQIFTSPRHITDIRLQEGETLKGAPCAGDTASWEIAQTVSGSGKTTRKHIIVKPKKSGLRTNMIITTNRRSYYVELSSYKETYMAGVSWNYQDDISIGHSQANLREPVGSDISLNDLNFNYEIEGKAPFRPTMVFDDMKHTYIKFPPDIAQKELPPLFVLSGKDKSQLVNYRYSIESNYYVVDGIFEAAALKMGSKKQDIIQIYNLSHTKNRN